MNSPPRLLDRGASQAELALLRAGASEEPNMAGQARLATALGLSAAGFEEHVGEPAAQAAGAGSTTGAGQLGTQTGLALSGTKLLTWLALLASLGVGVLVLRPSAPVEPTRQSFAATHAPEKSSRPASPRAEPLVLTPATHGTADAAAPVLPSLSGEVLLLDKARAALRVGEAAAAIATLERYLRTYPRGVLREEALLLRIEALAGPQRAAAAAAARSFLKAHPASAHAARVRAFLRSQQE